MSGLGKGITAASIGRLLMNRGYKVTAIKIDPYINIDAGLMSPFQHGEVYVLKDGGEVDLDLGNYERFLDVELTRDHVGKTIAIATGRRISAPPALRATGVALRFLAWFFGLLRHGLLRE